MAIARYRRRSLDTGGESAKKMMQHRRNFRTDTEAVSEVIGMVLLLAILVMFFTIIQVSVVPNWNKQVEVEEMKVTHDDMMFLPSDIEDVAIHETPKTCTVQLGARYPDRMIFRNPGPGAFGTLAVKEAPVPITVTYNDGDESTVPFNSKRITYELSGMINSPKLVYEHGVIITDWKWENVNLTTDEQKLIANDNIYIPILNGSSISKSAIGAESLAIKPYEYLDTLGDIDTVSVTLKTDYPEVWEKLLEDYITAGMASVSIPTNKIYINTSALPYLKLPNQTASGPLHAGMISCTVYDPDGGGGGGGGGGVGDANGTGGGLMTSGSQWTNIPSSDDMTKMDITHIAFDDSESLAGDFIMIIVNDDYGNWWKLIIDFAAHSDRIQSITARSSTTTETSAYNDVPLYFPLSYPIDLWDKLKYDKDDACYEYANISQPNCLVTYLGDDSSLKHRAVVYYTLEIDN